VFGLTVLGGFVSLLTIYPRMTVTAAFEAKEPLSSSFLVSNDGYLPAYSVSVDCMVGDIAIGPDQPPGPPITGTGPLTVMHSTEIPIVTLYPGAKEVIPFSDCIDVNSGNNLNVARFGLRVVYRPLLWPGHRAFIQEVYARNNGNGHFFWYSVPTDSN
jgi:hypothetical protein